MKYISESFFTSHDGFVFQGNDAARGPWQEDACHAGPVTGLIARALENLITDKQLVRLSIEFLRPIPMNGFSIKTETKKAGRMVTTASAEVNDIKGKCVAIANSLHMTEQDMSELPSAPFQRVPFESATPGEFSIAKANHALPFFGDSVEVRYPPGEDSSPGPTTLWMKTIPLLGTEKPTPFQSLCPLADCGNAISRNTEIGETHFVNPDITVVMHRRSIKEWLGSTSESFWESTGVGLARAVLFDDDGPVGTALQTLLLKSN